MMKLQSAGWIIAAGLICLPGAGRADLIERQFVQPGGMGAATGIVFQGSRNMKDLGKRKRTVSSVVVPSLNPVTVIPTLENSELRPKPRFGYGSDYEAQASPPQVIRPLAPVSNAISAPVYQFRYSYPVYRDYWITSPYHRYFSPYHSCGLYRGWSGWSGFSQFSISYGW